MLTNSPDAIVSSTPSSARIGRPPCAYSLVTLRRRIMWGTSIALIFAMAHLLDGSCDVLHRPRRPELSALELRGQVRAEAVIECDREDDAPEVPVRELRALLAEAKLVIGPRRLDVMVGVPRETDQRVEGEAGVSVPRIDRADPLLAAHESPVLEVVDGLEEPDRDQRLEEEEGERAASEGAEDRERHPPLDR